MNNSGLQTADWFNNRLADGGPVYAETNPDLFIVEPWNAVSSLFMMMPAIIWFLRIYPNFREYLFLSLLLPLGFLGGLGSTLFHAFRTHQAFLLLDVLPSAVLTLSLTIYLWIKILKHWWYIFIVIAISIGLRALIFGLGVPDHTAINLSYGLTGILIGLPLIYIQLKSRYYHLRDILLAIIFFSLALLFRELDAYKQPFLNMGTHFLWHLMSAFGSYFVFSYIYFLKEVKLLKTRIKRID